MNIVEASIDDLQKALSCGATTSVELVAKYLHRISAYDCRGPALNSIPILNPTGFEEAAASDDKRAQGHHVRPLEGIPYTVKDSYKVKSMSVAAGSPAFRNLKSSEDAFTVAAIRSAGGVLLGRTNMPPMADGGMQRGIYGRAENPYNPAYLAAAFATMKDMLTLLDVVTQTDEITEGDFWRNQRFIHLPDDLFPGKPDSFRDIAFQPQLSLSGIRIAVPSIYLGGPSPQGVDPTYTCQAVIDLWEQARKDLEFLGAEVVVVPDFPLVTAYENPALLPEGCPRLPDSWFDAERGPLVARAWDAFLKDNKDPEIPDLSEVNPLNIFPMRMRTTAELAFLPIANDIHWTRLPAYAKDAGLYETEGLAEGLQVLESLRKCLLDDYLTANNCDFFVFPAAGDVGPADADEVVESAAQAWRNGVKYSNGNRALRHLGVPTVSVPMGLMADKSMPVNLTFAGRAHDDVTLLKCATAYEATSRRRTAPAHAPPLPSDVIVAAEGCTRAARPELIIEQCAASTDEPKRISMRWVVKVDGAARASLETAKDFPPFELTVDGCEVPSDNVVATRSSDTYVFEISDYVVPMVERVAVKSTEEPVVRDMVMVVLLARAVSEASSSTSESQSAYNDLKRLIPSLAAELELLRTSLREHSLWLLRYGHTNSLPGTSAAGPSGQATTSTVQPPTVHPDQDRYIEPRPIPPPPGPQQQPAQPSSSSSSSSQQHPPPPPPAGDQEPELPGYSASDVPPYTGGFSTVSASTREEVRQRRDQLTEWLREGEDVLREYSARFAQLAEELGQPVEDPLGTWHNANPDNALPDYQQVEEREELMVGGVGEVPPPYLSDRPTPKGGQG
ncbi:hypothetical protein SLS64_008799 [Diaporthe eres]